jgi:hypothetical protein
LGFGLELSLTIDVGNCRLSSVNRGTWLTKTSLYDLPANHSSRNELGSSNALVSTNGNGSPVGRQAGNDGFLVAKSLHANTPVACVYETASSSLVRSTVPISPFRLPEVAQILNPISGIQFLVGRKARRVAGSWHGLSLELHPGVTAAAGKVYAIFASLSSCSRAASCSLGRLKLCPTSNKLRTALCLDSLVFAANVGVKLFGELRLEIPGHLLDCGSDGRAGRVKHPSALRATPSPKSLGRDP